MDYGLSHSLGRPAHFAARRQHIDVGFFELVDDVYITKDGVKPAPQASLKKWIGIHFYKMRARKVRRSGAHMFVAEKMLSLVW